MNPSPSALQPLIHTIGHSNHTTEAFIALLRQHAIETVIDVRSQPYSQWATQFNRETLRADLERVGIHYHFMGETLGGRPTDPALYAPGQERPDYRQMEQTAAYQGGIAEVLAMAHESSLAIMCSEGDHRQCHRHLLITQTLLKQGAEVQHIQPDGATVAGQVEAEQLSLFG